MDRAEKAKKVWKNFRKTLCLWVRRKRNWWKEREVKDGRIPGQAGI